MFSVQSYEKDERGKAHGEGSTIKILHVPDAKIAFWLSPLTD